MIQLMVVWLFLACTASFAFAQNWTLTITGTGPQPNVTFTGGTSQPPPFIPPPTTPPPTTPPPTTPPLPQGQPGDDLPFVFPHQPNPPGLLSKYYWVGYDPTTLLSLYEANPLEANPLPQSHLYAGQVLAGETAGLSIWAPVGVLTGTIRILVNGGTFRH
jgi:hypothetical protein